MILPAILSYLIGSIPFSYLIARLVTGKDIRGMGSGNVGATNVMRTTGRSAGIAALLLDVLKGAGSVWLAHVLGGDSTAMAVCGFMAMLGHSFPIFLGFRGGKSVATGGGAFGALAPLAMLSSIGVFGISLFLFRIVSFGSVIAAASFPVLAWLYGAGKGIVLWGAISATWIIVRHHGNIVRLFQGTEHKLGGGLTTKGTKGKKEFRNHR